MYVHNQVLRIRFVSFPTELQNNRTSCKNSDDTNTSISKIYLKIQVVVVFQTNDVYHTVKCIFTFKTHQLSLHVNKQQMSTYTKQTRERLNFSAGEIAAKIREMSKNSPNSLIGVWQSCQGPVEALRRRRPLRSGSPVRQHVATSYAGIEPIEVRLRKEGMLHRIFEIISRRIGLSGSGFFLASVMTNFLLTFSGCVFAERIMGLIVKLELEVFSTTKIARFSYVTTLYRISRLKTV